MSDSSMYKQFWFIMQNPESAIDSKALVFLTEPNNGAIRELSTHAYSADAVKVLIDELERRKNQSCDIAEEPCPACEAKATLDKFYKLIKGA